MKDNSKNKLRIVLLTRKGRPSGEKILKALVASNKKIVGVIAEKRSGLLLDKGAYTFGTPGRSTIHGGSP